MADKIAIDQDQNPPPSSEDLEALWCAVEHAVKERIGPFISMAKFLHQPDEVSAARYWTAQAAALLAAVPESPSWVAGVADDPVVRFPGEVSVLFDLDRVTLSDHDGPLCRAGFHPDAAAVVTEALGHARWGSSWSESVARHVREHGNVVLAENRQDLPWIAAREGVPGPRTRAISHPAALRAARAEALGPKKIARLYERMRKRS